MTRSTLLAATLAVLTLSLPLQAAGPWTRAVRGS